MVPPLNKNETIEGTDMQRSNQQGRQTRTSSTNAEGIIDVDELADSRRRQQERQQQQQQQQSSSVQTAEERDLLAIVRVLDEIDKEEEEEKKKKTAAASTSQSHQAVTATGRTLPQNQCPGAHSQSPTNAVPATTSSRQRQHHQARAVVSSGKSKERPSPQDASRYQGPAGAKPATPAASKKGKERDAAGEGDDINPALLRHLAGADRQPGAYHSITRPHNLDLEQQQLTTDPSASLLPTTPNTTTTQSSASHPTYLQSATLPHHHNVIEASLVLSQHGSTTTQRQPLQQHNQYDQADEETATTSQPSMSSSSTAALHHQGDHNSNSNLNIPPNPPPPREGDQQNACNHPSSSSSDNNNDVVLVEARDAGIKDFLQNRTFCLFLVGYLLAIFTIAILAGVIIALQREIQQLEQESQLPSRYDRYTYINNNGEYVTDEMQIVLDTAGALIKEYIDPLYNPSQFYAFQFLKRHTHFQSLSDQQKVQLYALFTFFYSLHYMDWPHPDRDYIVYSILGDCELNKKSGIRICNTDVYEDDVIRKLELAGNGTERHTISNVHGTLPAEVTMLRSLETIHIGFTDLSANLEDMLPRQLEGLVNLTVLDYGHNRMTSTIPTRIARLDKLTALSLKSNLLTSSIPSQVGTMTHLTSLELSYNQLIGGIPTELGNLATDDSGGKLKELSLQNNVLLGSLPTQLGSLRQLTSLRLQRNGLRETIPTQLGLLTNLETLQLWGNGMMTGPIPSQIGLMGSLRFLDLNGLDLTGTIPTQFGLLTRLERLQLQGNDGLTGLIPDGLCRVQGLSHFPVDCLKLDCNPDSCTCSCYGF